MNGADMIALLPVVVSGAVSVAVLLLIAVRRRHGSVAALTAFGFLLAFLSIFVSQAAGTRQVTPLLMIDAYARFFMGLIFLAAIAVTAFSYEYFERRGGRHEEYYVLLSTATLGGAVLVCATHFASFFLGLEVMSISLFALIAHPEHGTNPLEGSIKYLVLAGVSSAFLLFGMALIYAQLGTMSFADMGAALAKQHLVLSAWWLVGLILVMVGVGFKLALVPFHMWTPDIYQGAPAPVTAFVATISKGAMFALLLRYFIVSGGYAAFSINMALSAIAVASIVIGNVLALLQDNVKRILAYSSIAHLGYLLVAFLAAGTLARVSVTFYLVFYFVTMLGAFGIVGTLSGSRDEEMEHIDEYRGLFWSRPWTGALLTGLLFSLAGIPLTVGFLGKFYVVLSAVNADLWVLLFTLVAGSAIGLYYYLRIIVYLYLPPTEDQEIVGSGEAAVTFPVAGATLVLLALLTLWWGVYPAPLIHWITAAGIGL